MIRKAWIDARHPMVNQKLWGLTLLERNLKELKILGVEEVLILTIEDLNPDKYFSSPLPNELKTSFVEENRSEPFASLRQVLKKDNGLVLVLEGNSFNDRRILEELINLDASCGVTSAIGGNRGSVAVLSKSEASLFVQKSSQNLKSTLSEAVQNSKIQNLNLLKIDKHIVNLKRELDPFLISVEDSKQLEEADRFLRLTIHKDVNDFVAKYIHPPLEFAAVRSLVSTPITPSQITLFWIVLAGLAIPLLATGHLLLGLFLAAARGVMDGIDGKLARVTLRFSKAGDRLDHVTDTIYIGLFHLALGWHFSEGAVNSTAAKFTVILFASYCVAKIIPGIFQKLHKVQIYDYADIDKKVSLVGSRINNNVWLLILGTLVGLEKEAFYVVSIWMLATAAWYTWRLIWVTGNKRKLVFAAKTDR